MALQFYDTIGLSDIEEAALSDCRETGGVRNFLGSVESNLRALDHVLMKRPQSPPQEVDRCCGIRDFRCVCSPLPYWPCPLSSSRRRESLRSGSVRQPLHRHGRQQVTPSGAGRSRRRYLPRGDGTLRHGTAQSRHSYCLPVGLPLQRYQHRGLQSHPLQRRRLSQQRRPSLPAGRGRAEPFARDPLVRLRLQLM